MLICVFVFSLFYLIGLYNASTALIIVKWNPSPVTEFVCLDPKELILAFVIWLLHHNEFKMIFTAANIVIIENKILSSVPEDLERLNPLAHSLLTKMSY